MEKRHHISHLLIKMHCYLLSHQCAAWKEREVVSWFYLNLYVSHFLFHLLLEALPCLLWCGLADGVALMRDPCSCPGPVSFISPFSHFLSLSVSVLFLFWLSVVIFFSLPLFLGDSLPIFLPGQFSFLVLYSQKLTCRSEKPFPLRIPWAAAWACSPVYVSCSCCQTHYGSFHETNIGKVGGFHKAVAGKGWGQDGSKVMQLSEVSLCYFLLLLPTPYLDRHQSNWKILLHTLKPLNNILCLQLAIMYTWQGKLKWHLTLHNL